MKGIVLILKIILPVGVIFSGCGKQNDCLPPSLTVTDKLVVYKGDNLTFSVESVPGAEFSWMGPSNFKSTDQNPIITNISLEQAGDYSVTAKAGGCEKTKTISVEVLEKPACSPANNTIEFKPTMNFSSIQCGESSGKFVLQGSGLQGDFTLEFYVNPLFKGNAIYEFSTNVRNENNVFMQIGEAFVLSGWQATSGKLYVTVVNRELTATFCNVSMGSIQFNATKLASGKLLCR